ncbi:MAG: cytidylyltransferase [Betaproteobacteria bacterium]|nr:cytidylyltransferase [Betaproteobacteria bacterium]
MGSTRLPGKVLRAIGAKPLLAHVLDRLAQLRHRAIAVVATTVEARDEAIVQFCEQRGALVFRGSESNVLDRYFQCARQYGFDQVVRLTSDNPFTDIEELDRLLDLHLSSGADFSHSFPVLPVGVGAEVFRFEALAISAAQAHAPHHFEHVDEYMIEHPERFRTLLLEPPAAKNQPAVRLTVDDETDFRRANFIVARAGTDQVTTAQAIALCSQFA